MTISLPGWTFGAALPNSVTRWDPSHFPVCALIFSTSSRHVHHTFGLGESEKGEEKKIFFSGRTVSLLSVCSTRTHFPSYYTLSLTWLWVWENDFWAKANQFCSTPIPLFLAVDQTIMLFKNKSNEISERKREKKVDKKCRLQLNKYNLVTLKNAEEKKICTQEFVWKSTTV